MDYLALQKAFKYSAFLLVVVFLFGSLLATQNQTQAFSGSDAANYRCPENSRTTCTGGVQETPVSDCPGTPAGRFVCVCERDGEPVCSNAIPLPPSLRVLEFWFVRVLYAIWAFSGIIFTFILIFQGFRYMTSLGNSGVIEDVMKRIRYWLIGLVLVFLSYPILNTVFGAIGLSDTECFNDIQMPAFQIFFPNACDI